MSKAVSRMDHVSDPTVSFISNLTLGVGSSKNDPLQHGSQAPTGTSQYGCMIRQFSSVLVLLLC